MKPITRTAGAPIIALLLLAGSSAGETNSLCSTAGGSIPDATGPIDVPLAFDTAQRVVTGVRVELELQHPWVGDLVVEVIAPTGQTAHVLDRPGTVSSGFPGPWGCGGDDINATFTDGATQTADDACTISSNGTGTPVYTGDLLPLQSLSVFNGLNPEGVWTVRVSDQQAGDAGTLTSVCLVIDVEEDCDLDGVPSTCACAADFDGNGEVNLGDFGVFGAAFGSTAGDANYNPDADFDGNGEVNLGDFGVFGGQFGRSDCL